jgi:hypothetical protein
VKASLRELSVVRGWPAARDTLGAWRSRPLQVVSPWIAVSLFIAAVLLTLVWLVGTRVPADPSPLRQDLLRVPDDWATGARHLFRNNMIVLSLHAAACLAGFIVHMALHEPVEETGTRLAYWTRAVAIVAVAFVPVATLLSIGTQAWVLGARVSTLSSQLGLSEAAILRTTLPHSIPELTAIFLPLAAWLVLPMRRRANELLAATLLCVAIATPVLAVAAVVEMHVWPKRLAAERLANPRFEGMSLGSLEVDPTDHFSGSAMLLVGPAIGDETWDTVDGAVTVARRATLRSRSAAVVLSTSGGFVAHELRAIRTPHFCDQVPGMRLAPSSMRLDEIERLRWSSSGSNAAVVWLVEGERRIGPRSLDPGPVDAEFKRRC